MGFFDDIRKLTQPYDEDDEEFLSEPADEPTVAVGRRDTGRYAESYRAPTRQTDYFAEENEFGRDDTRVITRADNYREDSRPVGRDVYREEPRQSVRDSYRVEPRPASRSRDAEYAQDPAPARGGRTADRVMNIRTATSVQVVLAKPERFDQAAEIADHLREKRTVVMNLETTSRDVARRLVDFLSGVAYANDGNIKKVAINTYIITPFTVDIMGDLIDELENSGVSFY